jgi:hypothetical protein
MQPGYFDVAAFRTNLNRQRDDFFGVDIGNDRGTRNRMAFAAGDGAQN